VIDKQVKTRPTRWPGSATDRRCWWLIWRGRRRRPSAGCLHEQGARELTIVANNSGNGDHGLARLIISGRVRKVICSFPRSGDYSAFLNAYRARSLELELLPQAPSASACAATPRGSAGFFSPVSAGTKLGEGKEVREIDGRLHVFEKPLKGDVALIKANKADRWAPHLYQVGAEF